MGHQATHLDMEMDRENIITLDIKVAMVDIVDYQEMNMTEKEISPTIK